jgi:hypothetical protein
MKDIEVIGTEYSLNWFQRVVTWMYERWVWAPMVIEVSKEALEEVMTPEERAYIQKKLLEGGEFDGFYRTDH